MTLTQYLYVAALISLFGLLTAMVIGLVSEAHHDEGEIVDSGSGELIDLSAIDWNFTVLESSEPALLPALKVNQMNQRRIK